MQPVLRLCGAWDLSELEGLDAELSRIGLPQDRRSAVAEAPGQPWPRSSARGAVWARSDPGGAPVVPSSGQGTRGEERARGSAAAERLVLTVDGSRLESIDTAAAALILRHLAALGFSPDTLRLESFAESHRRVFEVVIGRLPLRSGSAAGHVAERGPLAVFGARCVGLGSLVAGHLSFFGLVLVELARLARRPDLLRGRELAAQFAQVCIGAIPVVLLVTFLIGTIMAYLLGQQAEQYGASIFVVDGVALGVVREFSPLIVATIVAGRSGAAFTAQLGTMRLTEEIDAIRTLGLSPEQVLVVPRVLALVVSLPLLVFAGDVAGFAGAMFVSDLMLGLTPHTFLERVEVALDARHYLIGLAKAPVFALWIAVIGCRMGVAVSRDTRAIGINTTSTVVQSIVAVILLDAAFAVLLQELGL